MVGGASDQQLASQSRAKQSLSVTVPTDLSVDTPPSSLRPPLPSQNNFLITNYVVAALPKSVEGADVDGIATGVNKLSSCSNELCFFVLNDYYQIKVVFNLW